MRYYQLTALGIGAVAIVQQYVAVALSPVELNKRTVEITVLIEVPGTLGSGIIIGREGNVYSVLTAKHVVKSVNPGEEADIVTNDGERYFLDSNNIKKEPEVDLAVVSFVSEKDYPVASLGNATEVVPGTKVYVAGFPLPTAAITSPIYNFTEGRVTANAAVPFDDGYSLVYSNFTLPGMSGGPVINELGEVIGVHGRGDTTEERNTSNPNVRVKTGFNLAIPINTYLSWQGKRENTTVESPVPVETPIAIVKKADDYFLEGEIKYQEGDYKGAIAAYDQAINLDDNYAYAYYNRGIARQKLGDNLGAIRDYSEAIRIRPNLPLEITVDSQLE